MNKAVLVIGSTGSGKTTFLEKLYRDYKEFEFVKWINPDFYVEDATHEFYNNPLAASRYVSKTVLPEVLMDGRDFIFDTTGANLKTLNSLMSMNSHYDFKILMVYCHPIISFRRNLLRERRLPRQVVVQNWLKVYSQIPEYMKLVKDGDIYIQETEYSAKEIALRDKDFYNIKSGINSLLQELNATSSFKKEGTKYTKQELKEKEQNFYNAISEVEYKFKDILLQKITLFVPDEKLYDNLTKWISVKK